MGNRSIVKDTYEYTKGINSGIFECMPDATLAVVDLGYGLYPDGVDEVLFGEYLSLRRKVYGRLGILPDSNQRGDVEYDDDDKRSVHVAAFYNLGLGRVAATACMRAIRKESVDDSPLPVERYFPEYFRHHPVGIDGCESSRLISLGRGALERYINARLVIRTHLKVCERDGIKDVLGMVDEGKEEKFSHVSGAPVKTITSPVYIEEYASHNVAIHMGVCDMISSFSEDAFRSTRIGAGKVVYIGNGCEKI